MVIILLGFVSDPSVTGVPNLLTPGLTMLLITAYAGYRLLEWQKEAEKRAKQAKADAAAKMKSDSKASEAKLKEQAEKEKPKTSGTQIMTKEDLLKQQERLKDKSNKSSKDVRAATKKTQYFLTMNGEPGHGQKRMMLSKALNISGLYTAGPGRPALVPFPRGFKAASGECLVGLFFWRRNHTEKQTYAQPGSPDGTLWWNNVDNLNGAFHLPPSRMSVHHQLIQMP